jgi:hypothetical protein
MVVGAREHYRIRPSGRDAKRHNDASEVSLFHENPLIIFVLNQSNYTCNNRAIHGSIEAWRFMGV